MVVLLVMNVVRLTSLPSACPKSPSSSFRHRVALWHRVRSSPAGFQLSPCRKQNFLETLFRITEHDPAARTPIQAFIRQIMGNQASALYPAGMPK